MASSVCSSSCIANINISRVSVLDIINEKNEWNYVVDVIWSDFRQHKIHRNYDEIARLHTKIRRMISTSNNWKAMYLKTLPKVAARGFFTRNGIKLYVQNQANAHNFFRFIIRLPQQISSLPVVLDFFERRTSDPDINLVPSNSLLSLQPGSFDKRGRFPSTDSGICRSETSDMIGCSAYDSSGGSGYSSDESSTKNDVDKPRTIIPPSSLPVRSCFESDDEDCWSTEYQRMLEDVSAFEFHEIPKIPENKTFTSNVKSLDTFEMDFEEAFEHNFVKFADKSFQKTKMRKKTEFEINEENESIISPYSPNKLYFYLVHFSDEIMTC